MVMTIRIPITKLKRGQVETDKIFKILDGLIPSDAKITKCDLQWECVRAGQVSNLKGALFRSRCLATGCTNSKIYEWYHVPGQRLNTYNGKEKWLVEWASPGKVACRSCKIEHDLSDLTFACDHHKDDYRVRAPDSAQHFSSQAPTNSSLSFGERLAQKIRETRPKIG